MANDNLDTGQLNYSAIVLPPRKPTDHLSEDGRAQILNAGKKGIADLVYSYRGAGALSRDEQELLRRNGLRARLEDLYYGPMAYGDAGAPLMAYVNRLPKAADVDAVKSLIGCLMARELIAATPPENFLAAGGVVNQPIASIDSAKSKQDAIFAAEDLVSHTRNEIAGTADLLKREFASAQAHSQHFGSLTDALRYKHATQKVDKFHCDLRAEIAAPQTERESPWR